MSHGNQIFRRLFLKWTVLVGLWLPQSPILAANPNHFSPKTGWTWVYEYRDFEDNRQFSNSTDAKLWLTLKSYQESDSQFSSTWEVSLTRHIKNAHLVPPVFSNESHDSWADTNVTVNGWIDSGMHFDDFLPREYKTAPYTPPLFLNHCKLPATISQEPSAGYTTVGDTIKPPFYVYGQFSNSNFANAIYNACFGIDCLCSE
jgi:hypothetical protein